MILTLFILFIFILGIYTGVRRGLLHQLIMTLGFTISYILAMYFYDNILYFVEMLVPYPALATYTESPYALYGTELMFDIHQGFYHFLSFLIFLLIGWLITRFIGKLLAFVQEYKFEPRIEYSISAAVSFFVHYIWLVLFIFLLSLFPSQAMQSSLENSFVAQTMVERTPILSDQLYHDFVVQPVEESRTQEGIE